jgi:Cd2+/Zn2+-exporting ATPase
MHNYDDQGGGCSACARAEDENSGGLPERQSPAGAGPAAEGARASVGEAGARTTRRPGFSRGERIELVRIGAGLALGVLGFILWEGAKGGAWGSAKAVASIVLGLAYLVAGYDVVLGAAKNVARGQVFDELFLMSIASLGAFAIGAMEEAVGVMVFYKLGEFMQERAAAKSRSSIRAILDLRPDKARVLRGGAWVDARPEELKIGDLVLVRPGERVPADGVVADGYGSFDGSALTGESAPRPAGPGDEALSGFIARDAALTVRVERPAAESSAARVIELVENASRRKARTELFISRFARWYTPAVVLGAALVAIIPPLVLPGASFSAWAYRALVMLVISCPCAFVISVPLGYFGGLGGMARRGILVKGASVIDALADAKTVVFDKTGTLTDGRFRVAQLRPEGGFSERELLAGAAAAGSQSNHPLARAIRAAWEASAEPGEAGCDEGSYSEIAGHGTVASVGGREVVAGADRILHLKGIAHHCDDRADTVVHVAVAGAYAGRIALGDALKPDAAQAVAALKAQGVRRVAMLTGDAEGPARRAAGELGLDELHHGLLPEGKLERLEAMLDEERGRGSVIFVGDGINDAPVLARADAGIAMGGVGSDAAVESADVVIMGDEPSKVAEALARAKRTRAIVAQNIAFALGVKLLFLAFGAFGLAAMWEAVIADVGVALLAVLNSTRALR